MADIFETNSTPPLYRAIPVLEVADEAPAVLDVLAADNEADAPLDVLPASSPSRPPQVNKFALLWRCIRAVHSMLEWLFGVAVLMVGLALGRLPGALGPLVGFLGALLLALVLVYLPFLQMRLAMTNRLSAAFEIRKARRNFRRAPWAFAFSFVVTLLFALPLYLLKIEMVPREAAWLPSLVFIAFIFPTRLLTGWAMGRAVHRPAPRHWFFRWTGRLPFLPAALFYVLIVFFTQYTSWNGVWSLYEQHAFLVPVPFFGM